MTVGEGESMWAAHVRRQIAPSFLIGAVVLGGAGSQHPVMAMIVTLLALLLAAMAADRLSCPVHDRIDSVAIWLCVIVVVLVLVQIVPLPPGLWQRLPGREIAAAVDAAQGRSSWRPLSLAPDLTVDIALALIAPMVAFGLGRSSSSAERQKLIRLTIGCALVGALLGLGQIATGPDGLGTIWPTSHAGSGVGWFVNRNHQAAFLLVGIVLCGVPEAMPFEAAIKNAKLGRIEQGTAVGAMFVLLSAGVLATLSRTGVALLPLALALAVALRQPGRRMWFVVLGVAVVAAALLVVSSTAVGDAMLNRYGLAPQDDRFAFWTNTIQAARGYAPLGTGFGTFVGIYQMVEPLDQVGPLYVVHAHDDYLEWWLEGGWPIAGAILVALGCSIARLASIVRERQARSSRYQTREAALAALGALLVLALASLTDFPLRMPALGVVFGFCAGFAANPRYPRNTAGHNAGALFAGRRNIAAPAVAVLLGVVVVCADLSQDRVLAGDGSGALSWAGWRAGGWSLRGFARLRHGNPIAAGTDAARALAIDPLDQMAVFTAGLVAQAEGDRARAAAMAGIAGQLGWRDLPTQVWLAQLAERQGDLPYEVQRIDALLRQQKMADRALEFLVGLVGEPQGRAVIVARLTDSPGWKQGFFNRLAGPAASEPGAIVALVELAHQSGVRITPDDLVQVMWHMAEAGQVDAVRALRRTMGANPNLGDGDFTSPTGRLPDQPVPYRWRGNAASGGEVYIGADGDTQALHVSSDGAPVAEAVRQRLLLSPGHYRLTDRWAVVDGDRAVSLGWAMRCMSAGAEASSVDVPIAPNNGDLVVPPGCDQQDLRLDVSDPAGKPIHIALQHVEIDSVR